MPYVRDFQRILAALVLLQLQLVCLDNITYRYLAARRRGRRGREHWVKPWILRRPALGFYDRLMVELRNEDLRCYKNFLRMPPDMFDELVQRLTPYLERQDTFMRKALTPGLKVALTLRYLASGDENPSLMFGFRVGCSTIAQIIPVVCEAIIQEYSEEAIVCPSQPEEWKEKAQGFWQRSQVPHAIGAMDGKHVACNCPYKTGSLYHNYKGFFSVVLLALVDSDYKFLWIGVGHPGSMSDAQIFNNSELRQKIEDGTIGFPAPQPIPGEQRPLPYFILGDDAFAMKTWLMKPQSRRNMNHDQRIYNYRISRGRRIVENVFGVLSSRFRVLRTTIQFQAQHVTRIIYACCILHNLMRMRFRNGHIDQFDKEETNGEVRPGGWREEGGLIDLNQPRGMRGTEAAKAQRLYLQQYFNSPAGALPFQERMI